MSENQARGADATNIAITESEDWQAIWTALAALRIKGTEVDQERAELARQAMTRIQLRHRIERLREAEDV